MQAALTTTMGHTRNVPVAVSEKLRCRFHLSQHDMSNTYPMTGKYMYITDATNTNVSVNVISSIKLF